MNIKFKLLTVLIVILSACSDGSDGLFEIEKKINTSPDSARSMLEKIPYKQLSDKHKAQYGILYMRIRQKRRLPITPDSLLAFSQNYYSQHKQKSALAWCYWLRANSQISAYKLAAAMENLLDALELSANYQSDELKALIFYDMGVIFTQQRDYSSARAKFVTAAELNLAIQNNREAFYCILYIGRTYNEEKKYLQALSFYKKYIPLCNDSIAYGILWQEIGMNHYELQQYDSARHYLSRSTQYPYLRYDGAVRNALLADLFFDTGKPDSAIFYTQKALSMATDMRCRKTCYRILANSYTLKNELAKVQQYMILYQDCSDSIRIMEAQPKGSYVEKMYNTEQKVVQTLSWVWYLIISIVIIVILSIVLYLRKHRTLLKSKQQLLHTTLKHSHEKEQQRIEILNEKRSALIDHIKRVRKEQKLFNPMDTNFTERIIKMYNGVLNFGNTELFMCEMDGNFNSYIKKLKQAFPEISEKELQWCCLQLLDVPTHERLILLNYKNDNSLKRLKTRLATRLQLQNASLLQTYLIDIYLQE